MNPPTLRPARATDREAVMELLARASLSLDLEPDWFPAGAIVAERSARILGAAGCEYARDMVLLRSVVVATEARGDGIGAALVADRLAAAKRAGACRAFLLTTTAAPWFARLKFAPVSRDAVPPAIAATREFASLCPVSASCLARDLANG